MTKTYLKMMAMQTLTESKLSKTNKLTLLNKLKEADMYQCMGYVLDQKIYKLNEAGKKEIKKRFKKKIVDEVDQITDEGMFSNIASKIPAAKQAVARNIRSVSKGYPKDALKKSKFF
jgi:DNA-binding PadR family transcriptional regulator